MTELGPTPFGPVLIVGTGLIGGSMGRLIRRSYPEASVLGVDREEIAARAEAAGHVSAGYGLDKLDRLVEQAGLVILATPVSVIIDLIPGLAQKCRPGTVIIDTGSTKRRICETALEHDVFASGEAAFIGGHPMAGSPKSGVDHAKLALLKQAPYVVCPVGQVPEESFRRVVQFLRQLSFHPVLMDPAGHDDVVAATSHIPHLLAVVLTNHVGALAENPPLGPLYHEVAGGGLDTMTLKASAPPEMWADILSSNSDAVARHLIKLADALVELAGKVEYGGVSEILEAARDRRERYEQVNYRHKEDPLP